MSSIANSARTISTLLTAVHRDYRGGTWDSETTRHLELAIDLADAIASDPATGTADEAKRQRQTLVNTLRRVVDAF
jgi:hypothetical protein